MVEGTSFMGLGGPNLVKGATGQVIDSEPLGGARMHTAVSGVAHYMAKDDADCLALHPPALPPIARARRAPPPAPAAGARRRRSLRRAAGRPSPALRRSKRSSFRIFDARRLRRVPARIRARDAVRQRAARRPPGRRDRQPPRLPEGARTAAHRRHHLYRIRAQGGVLRGDRRTPRHCR